MIVREKVLEQQRQQNSKNELETVQGLVVNVETWKM